MLLKIVNFLQFVWIHFKIKWPHKMQLTRDTPCHSLTYHQKHNEKEYFCVLYALIYSDSLRYVSKLSIVHDPFFKIAFRKRWLHSNWDKDATSEVSSSLLHIKKFIRVQLCLTVQCYCSKGSSRKLWVI